LTLWEKNDRIYKLLVKAKNPGDVIVKGIGYSSLFRDSGLCRLNPPKSTLHMAVRLAVSWKDGSGIGDGSGTV
jgi:hypothetical protein